MYKKNTNFLQETCETISDLFNVVITIIDDNYLRVAGTAEYADEVGTVVQNANVFKRVLEKNETVIIRNPAKEKACMECKKKEYCNEKAAIYAPIEVKGVLKGAMGIIALSEDQLASGLFEREAFASFTESLATLISGKIQAEEAEADLRASLLETNAIFDSVHDGIIVVDNNALIHRINKSAQNKFGLSDKYIGRDLSLIIPKPIAESIMWKKEYVDYELTITGGNGEEDVLLTSKRIDDDTRNSSMILIMKTINDARNIATKLVHEADYNVEFGDIVGESAEIKDIIDFSSRIAESDSTVLIRGESGTGKELFARAIHSRSSRKDGPFVAINCGAIPESLLESELFGYEDGAFTGAKKGGKIGKCQLANGGTLFLDEVGDIPLFLQVKFLRVLQERVVERIGSNKSVPIDIRVIAATNRNLEEMIEKGEFRSDLYYRLNVIPLMIPPLRERTDDILVITKHFIEKYSKLLRKNITSYTAQVADVLTHYPWPGNIRELENTIECALNTETQDVLTVHSLPSRIKQSFHQDGKIGSSRYASISNDYENDDKTLRGVSRRREMDEINKLLSLYGNDTKGKKEVAKALGISLATLYRKLNNSQ